MENKVMVVTPASAKEWLEHTNGKNRLLSKQYVSYLAQEMEAGNWRLTHQGIAFDSQGNLVDGQHRLAAIVKANKSVEMLVTTGLPDGRFPIIDRGVVRSVSVVTNLPSWFTEIYGLLLSMVTTGPVRQSPDDICSLHEKLGIYSETLRNCCGTATKFFSSAPIRAAAVIALEVGENEVYVLNTYRNLVLQNLEILPHIALSLVRQYNRGLIQTGGGQYIRKEIYAKARHLFTEKNRNMMIIRMSPVQIERCIYEAKAIVESSVDL